MARPLRRVLAVTAVSATLLIAAAPAAAAPTTHGCREIREPIWVIIC